MPSRETVIAGSGFALMCLWTATLLAYGVAFGEPVGLAGTLIAFVPVIAQRERGRLISPFVARLHAIWVAVLTVAVLTAPAPWSFRLRAIAAAIVIPAAAMIVLTCVSLGLGLLVNSALNQETEPRYLRVPLLYRLGSIVLIGPFASIAVTLTPRHAGWWMVAGILGAMLVLTCGWLAAFRVELTGSSITYRTVRGSRTMLWANVDDAEVWRDRLGTQRLTLKPKAGSAVEPLQINLSVLQGSSSSWLLKRVRPWLLPKPRYRYNRSDGPRPRSAD